MDRDVTGGVYVDERLHQHDGIDTHARQALPMGEAVQEVRNQSPPAVHGAGL